MVSAQAQKEGKKNCQAEETSISFCQKQLKSHCNAPHKQSSTVLLLTEMQVKQMQELNNCIIIEVSQMQKKKTKRYWNEVSVRQQLLLSSNLYYYAGEPAVGQSHLKENPAFIYALVSIAVQPTTPIHNHRIGNAKDVQVTCECIKESMVKSSKFHHGTTGHCYGFRAKPSYEAPSLAELLETGQQCEN